MVPLSVDSSNTLTVLVGEDEVLKVHQVSQWFLFLLIPLTP